MNILNNKQSGLSLVEILVALVISIFLMGGVIQVYIGNKVAYRFSDASSRIQENARFALDIIKRDARLSGFFGCVDIRRNSKLVQNHLNIASDNYDPLIHNFTNLPPVTLTPDGGLNGSDNLTIRGSKPGSASLSATLAKPGSDPIQISGTSNFADHDIILITNCWTSDIFEADTASATTLTHTLTGASPTTPGNMELITDNDCTAGTHCLNGNPSDADPEDLIDSNLESEYTANNSSVYSLQTVTYSILASESGSGEPALFRSENGNNQELIGGIEQMLVSYGVDTDFDIEDVDADNSANQYFNSSDAIDQNIDLNNVTSLRVWIVVRSEADNVVDDFQTYSVNGVSTVATDHRLRQVFSITINLRNR